MVLIGHSFLLFGKFGIFIGLGQKADTVFHKVDSPKGCREKNLFRFSIVSKLNPKPKSPVKPR